MQTANRVSDFINALGGTNKVSAMTSRVPSAVSQWKKRGHIPSTAYLQMRAEAERLGISVDTTLFGFTFAPPSSQARRDLAASRDLSE